MFSPEQVEEGPRMYLLTCMSCERRFIVDEGDDGTRWSCPDDQGDLRLVITGLSGAPGQIEAALGADRLAAAARIDASVRIETAAEPNRPGAPG
jgi:hypothetical protein